MSAVLVRDAMRHIDVTARIVLAACSEGFALRTNLAVPRLFTKHEQVPPSRFGGVRAPSARRGAV